MELKKRLSFRNVFIVLYVFSFLIYLIVGFLPAGASSSASGELLEIPAINLEATIVNSELKDGNFTVPDYEVGKYSRAENKVFLFGHSTTVFSDLDKISLRNEIRYGGKLYKVISREIVLKEKVNMTKILSRGDMDTIIIMTCAGELLENRDATHRLILTATAE